MGRLRDWWDRLTGRSATAVAAPRRRAPQAGGTPSDSKQPGELSLADGPPRRKASRTTRGGVDPYSNDAGYAKPHSWERVDHD